MKTNIYDKKEHLEGYVGKGDSDAKTAVQIAYEAGNDVNEVNSFGKETSFDATGNKISTGNSSARDGFDNTGTQGKDSLSDDAYNSSYKSPTRLSAESHTGSSSADSKTTDKANKIKRNEDDVLNTGL